MPSSESAWQQEKGPQQADARDLANVEDAVVAGQILGRTRRHKVVVFDGDVGRVGQYTDVALESTTGATFTGREVEAPALAGSA